MKAVIRSTSGTDKNSPALASGGRAIDCEARERLRRSGYARLREITCEVFDELVVLRGILPSFYLKQVALAAVIDLDGVRRVDNQIRVIATAERLN
jgi:osmotically-inducible protein OsmY